MQVLDEGYVEYIEHWGSDERIIEAARQSTGKGFLGWDPGICPRCEGSKSTMQAVMVWDREPKWEWEEGQYILVEEGIIREEKQLLSCKICNGKGEHPGDMKLLRFLWEKQHTTPFEVPGLSVKTEAPIMVYREWHRHRTQTYNEKSARYEPLPNTNYMPSINRMMINQTNNKQASRLAGSMELTEENAELWSKKLQYGYNICEQIYQEGLQVGVPKELARLILPVGRYSGMIATTDLLNWLRFLRLRCKPDAQWEIRQFANAVRQMLEVHFPRTMSLFNESMK